MSNANANAFPSSHTTTTSTNTKISPYIWFDPSYLNTKAGLIKAVVSALNLISFICGSTGPCHGCGTIAFFGSVSMIAFWITLILLGFYLFHLVERLQSIPWLLCEFIYCLVWSILYFIASLLIVFKGSVYAAAGFFGLLATALYAMDCFMKYKAYTSGEVAQGEITSENSSSKA